MSLQERERRRQQSECDQEAELERRKLKATAYEENYSWSALCNAYMELRKWPKGSRNFRFNKLGYKLGGLIARNWIGRERVESFLLKACKENGLLADDGEQQCRDTLASGINAGALRPYHDIGSERSEDGS